MLPFQMEPNELFQIAREYTYELGPFFKHISTHIINDTSTFIVIMI